MYQGHTATVAATAGRMTRQWLGVAGVMDESNAARAFRARATSGDRATRRRPDTLGEPLTADLDSTRRRAK